jgi:outer membrane protein assembly factor BamA
MVGNIVYQDNNLFRGAELLRIKLKGALEAQNVWGDFYSKNHSSYQPFNTYEYGTEASIIFPKFFFPINQEKVSKYANPKTNITVGLNYQARKDYTRYISNFNFGYDWREGSNKRHLLSLLDMNFVKVMQIDSTFYNYLINNYSRQILNSYQNHMTFGPKYSYIYNDQIYNKIKNFNYFRFNIELSGINWIFNNLEYKLFNIAYSQYWKFDLDYRHYFYFNQDNILVIRSIFGLGAPQNNSKILPFEKSFYGGGANDIRAWKLRTLGPGGFSDNISGNFDKTGDIMIEQNIEYRFPLYKFLKGAMFIDAGNVWLINKDENRINGEFDIKNPSRIIDEFAIGGGIGARFDFKFFIIRLDAAIPLRDPAINSRTKWVLPQTTINKIVFNLGIGYPF